MSFRLPYIAPDDPADCFPDSQHSLQQPNGLLAYGGDLSSERLIQAYRRGIFPWYSDDEPIMWWSPNPRTVFIPGEVRASKRLERRIRQQNYALTLDAAFGEVITACAAPRAQQDGTWLLPEMREAYCQLHAQGYAHSIEVWQSGELVAGLYGISLGRAFFGESMFTRATDMSKIALYTLSNILKEWGFLILDGQVGSQHLFHMGARNVLREDFEKTLRRAIPTIPLPGVWQIPEEYCGNCAHLPSKMQ